MNAIESNERGERTAVVERQRCVEVNDMAVMAMAVVEVEPSCEERRGPVHDNIKVSDGQVSHNGSNPDHLLRRRWRQQNQKAHS